MTVNVNMGSLGFQPTFYGAEPPEGRKVITSLVNWATDTQWFFDFLMLQQQRIFTMLQSIVVDFQLTTTAGFSVFVNGNLVYDSSTGGLVTTGLPYTIPVFAKNPAKVLLQGRAGIGGSAVVNFCNFPLIGSPKGM